MLLHYILFFLAISLFLFILRNGVSFTTLYSLQHASIHSIDFKTLIHQLREGRIKLGPSKRLRIASDIAKKLNQLHKAGFVICDFPNIGVSGNRMNTRGRDKRRHRRQRELSMGRKSKTVSRVKEICSARKKQKKKIRGK